MSDSAILKHSPKALFGRCPESQLSGSPWRPRTAPGLSLRLLTSATQDHRSQDLEKALPLRGSGESRPQPVVQSVSP